MMKIFLWVLQVLLALAFVAHGWMMLAPPAAVAAQMNATLPRWFQIFLGIAEVLAGIGLTLPGLTRIKPVLVPAAAIGVMVVMASATVFHFSRGEIKSAVTTLVLLAMASFVAWMRLRVVPIRGRDAAKSS